LLHIFLSIRAALDISITSAVLLITNLKKNR
jgi:hypothetical protein